MINKDSALAARFWESGRLDDCPIYDFHGHMHEMPGGYIPAATPEQMMVTMRRAGMKSFIFCSHLALFCAEVGEKANIEPVTASKSQDDVMLHAYLGVQSFNLDFRRDAAIFESRPEVYVGFKFLQGYYNVPMEHPMLAPYWEYINRRKLLALCHTWAGDRNNGPDNVRAIASKYPDAVIVCGHSFHMNWGAAIKLANEFPNIYLELTAVLDDRGALERFVREVGSERILFGTDLPWFSTFQGIGSVLDAEMTDEDRHNIFHRNGEKLLSRFKF